MKKVLSILIIWGGLLILTSVPTPAIDISKGIILDVPQEILESQFGKIPLSQLTRQDSMEIASYRFTGDTLKLLAILVEWNNRPGTYPKETFDSLLFSRGVFPGGSVADYYYEVSYGQLNIVGEVIDWYNAGTYTIGFDFEELLPELDSVIDYSQFDGNNDGDVDAVTFIRSGNGKEDSGDWNDIWSYAYSYAIGTGPGPFDGVYVSRWNTSPETQPLHDPLYPPDFSGVDTLNKIRVFCHELGHGLGLPDLYDYDSKLNTSTYYTPGDANDHPLVDWCLMGYYGYGLLSIGSQVPSHLCGWSKKELGWIDPIGLVGEFSNLVINSIETTKDSSLYLLPIDPAEGEFFLLEYRNPGSEAEFDKIDSDFSVYFWPDLTFGGDSLDRGLIITHVHDSLCTTWGCNDGTPNFPHYSVIVEDAGYNPSLDTSYNPEGHLTDSAQWWYPYETRRAAPFSNDVSGQNVFSPTTYPNSDGYSGPSGITVIVDSIVGERLYAYVYVPMPVFSLYSPSDSVLIPYEVTFEWMDPNPWNQLYFDLHISTSKGFHPDSTLIYDSLLSNQYTDSLEVGTYYWKVRAYNESEERWSSQTWTLFSGICGDATADGLINLSDPICLANYYFGKPCLINPLVSDVDCDNLINLGDALIIANVYFGKPGFELNCCP